MDYRNDICPIMSIGQEKPAYCTHDCAWFDTDREECAVSVINGNLKVFQPGYGIGRVETDK